MYYKEKIINGVLHYRSMPNDAWQIKIGYKADAVNALSLLSDERRMEVFNYFCSYCGCNDPQCKCWNDK